MGAWWGGVRCLGQTGEPRRLPRLDPVVDAGAAAPDRDGDGLGRLLLGEKQQGLITPPVANAAFAGGGSSQLLAFVRSEGKMYTGLLPEAVSIPESNDDCLSN